MTTTSRAKRFFFFFSLRNTRFKEFGLSLRLQILPFRIAGVPCAMRAVAFSTMQGPLSRTHSTVPLAGRAPSSLSPLRRRHTIRRHVDHHQRRLLTPPSHASTPFSKEQQQKQQHQHQQQHGEEGSTEAEEAAEAVAKAVRKGVVSVIFLIAWLGASSLEKDSKPLATSFFFREKKKNSPTAPPSTGSRTGTPSRSSPRRPRTGPRRSSCSEGTSSSGTTAAPGAASRTGAHTAPCR